MPRHKITLPRNWGNKNWSVIIIRRIGWSKTELPVSRICFNYAFLNLLCVDEYKKTIYRVYLILPGWTLNTAYAIYCTKNTLEYFVMMYPTTCNQFWFSLNLKLLTKKRFFTHYSWIYMWRKLFWSVLAKNSR